MKPATTPCRCCGQSMRHVAQPPLRPNAESLVYITCWNPTCAMYGQTLTTKSYATLDLTPYLKPKP